jgi:hypothetical protein
MRRELRFRSFDDIRSELNRLEQGSVETTGNWSYFQILAHLTKAVEGSMKGLKREMPFWKKKVVGPILYRVFAMRGYIPEGIKGPPADRIEGNEAEALAQFRKALETFEKFEGPLSDHPILGRLDKKQWTAFHSMHFANHVGHAKLKDPL